LAQGVKEIQAGAGKPSAWYGDADTGVVGLYGFEEGQTPPEGVPADVIPLVRQKLADMRAGRLTRFDIFSGPIQDNQGNIVVPEGVKLTQADLEVLGGGAICMNWLAAGTVGEIPPMPGQ